MACELAKTDIRCTYPYSKTGTTYSDVFQSSAEKERSTKKRSLRKDVCENCNEISEDTFSNMMNQIDTGDIDVVSRDIPGYFQQQRNEYESLSRLFEQDGLVKDQLSRFYELMKLYDPSRYKRIFRVGQKTARAVRQGRQISEHLKDRFRKFFIGKPYDPNAYLLVQDSEQKRYADLLFLAQVSEPTAEEWYELFDLSCKYDPATCTELSEDLNRKRYLEGKPSEDLSLPEIEELRRLWDLYGSVVDPAEKAEYDRFLDQLSSTSTAEKYGLNQLYGGKKKKKSKRRSKKSHKHSKRSKTVNKYASRRKKL